MTATDTRDDPSDVARPARRRRRGGAWKVVVAGIGVLAAAGAAAAAVGFGGAAEPAAKESAPHTVEVVRTTLVDVTEISGTLGYGDPVALPSRSTGTVTNLPAVGATVTRGKSLFTVDNQPVVLLYGTLPAYRPLTVGAEGPDVTQLEQNLRALGYDGFDVDDTYSAATGDAVREWQEDLGLPETGVVELGRVVFVAGAVRVAAHQTNLGAAAGPGQPVLTYTLTTRVVTASLEVADQHLAPKGAKVTVRLPGGGTVAGTVTAVSTVAESTGSDSGSQPPGSQAPAEDAAVEVTVAVADQSKLGSLDGAPVTVQFVAAERKDVLAVPVNALLALAEGGYGVEVVDESGTHVVAVETGLFANGLVEVSGAGIAAGTKVGVPAP